LNATSGPQMQIVGGSDADECEWKWQVGIMNKDDTEPWCGGTLISEEWVFTAAHCVQEWPGRLKVVAGQHTISKKSGNEQYRNVKEIVMHEKYNSETMTHDFALLRLESPMNFNQCVGAACLPTKGDLKGGETCWISGWGTLASGGESPDVLQEASVQVLSLDACRKSGYSSSEILDDMICAQGTNSKGQITDACQGDSGGPLVCEQDGVWRLFGATSWGRGCAGKDYPGIWARVADVLGWIDSTRKRPVGDTEDPPDAPPSPPEAPPNGCVDKAGYIDPVGFECWHWESGGCVSDSTTSDWGYSDADILEVRSNCKQSCGLC